MSASKQAEKSKLFNDALKQLGGNAEIIDQRAPDFDWINNKVCTGTVKSVGASVIKEKTRRYMEVQTEGGLFSLWENVQLEKLFNTTKAGDKVLVVLTGTVPLPGGKTMKTFEIAHIAGKE